MSDKEAIDVNLDKNAGCETLGCMLFFIAMFLFAVSFILDGPW